MFFQTCLHEGAPVGSDCAKYLIRADVICGRSKTHEDTQADQAAFVLLQKAEAIDSQLETVGKRADQDMTAGQSAARKMRKGLHTSDSKQRSTGGRQASPRDDKVLATTSARALRKAAFKMSTAVAAMFGGSQDAAASAAALWRTR